MLRRRNNERSFTAHVIGKGNNEVLAIKWLELDVTKL
jgi:hypothetical protein